MNQYTRISAPGKKFALLIDPGKLSTQGLIASLYSANESGVNMILVGGSLLSVDIDQTLEIIKKHSDIPVYLFPGSLLQLSNKADALFLLSMVSGRNPDYLIGNHVIAAPFIKRSNLEVISTAYILIDGGVSTSVEYISNTKPIPATKSDIVVATAMAAEMLGHKIIYLEAGSGAVNHVPIEVIREVKNNTTIPLIVGGGIDTADKAEQILAAGADIIVVGTAVEKKISNLDAIIKGVKQN